MGWIIGIVVVLLVLGFIAHRQETAEKAAAQAKAHALRTDLRQAFLMNRVTFIDPYSVGYKPVKNERLFAVIDDVTTQSSGLKGRLLVTDRAVVFESSTKNQRTTYGRISAIRPYLDGLKIEKRSGSPIIYKASNSVEGFLMLEAAFEAF